MQAVVHHTMCITNHINSFQYSAFVLRLYPGLSKMPLEPLTFTYLLAVRCWYFSVFRALE